MVHNDYPLVYAPRTKNVAKEMDKAIAINVMANAIENSSMNIVEAAEFAQVCRDSVQTVGRWVFSLTSISAYSCLKDVDDFISGKLS